MNHKGIPAVLSKGANIVAEIPTHAYAWCLVLLTTTAAAQQGEFTDQVRNAKAVDTKALRDSAKEGADNWGFILSIGAMLVGFVLLIFGIMQIASAGRSEGRKSATGGWIMTICGGAMGAGMAVYLLMVSVFTGSLAQN